MSLKLAGYAWLWKFTLLGFSEKFRLYNIWNQFFCIRSFFSFKQYCVHGSPQAHLRKKLLKFYVVILIYKISPAKFISGVTLQAPVCL